MKTPRTDAAKFRVGDSDHFAVHVTHAEQLEIEIAAMTALADRLAEALRHSLWTEPSPCRCVHFSTPPHVCYAHIALTDYEKHKKQTP